MPEPGTFFHEKVNEIIATIAAAIVSVIILFFKRLPGLVKDKTNRKVVLHDWRKDSRVFGFIQDDVNKLNAIYGFVIQYHNHGPKKMTVLIECTGDPCKDCDHKCSNKRAVKRLQKDWFERPIDNFWLNNVCLKTLELDRKINTISHKDLDTLHREIWDDANIFEFKEVLIKAKNDGFITLGFCFCRQHLKTKNTDGVITNLAHKIKRYI